ncbi:hypothetical protein [Vitiosangium sp. GDMCC 1.1324]|uniref:hypothetical protein n=1 Tax=Vitiosangium sp. (strain GDMCC 1.1324) TaxID=2138576 RepID=UPI000D38385B|nr:hypothetical protein [Vitiosangium sp. GDMCC 1.1324]PTL85515.1 hypothetical protein DAT35_01995 [Vitiosangium sp. GDMCC 1.1324]
MLPSRLASRVLGRGTHVTNPSDLAFYGGEANVKTIPLGSLVDRPDKPECGSTLRERSSSTVYAFGMYYSDRTLRKRPVSAVAGGIVPDGSLSSIPAGGDACIW